MTRIRPLSPFEWAYVGATPAFPPFAIQLLVESSDEISRAALEAAVAAAFAANRLSGMKLCGAWWVEGEAPHLRDQAGDAENFQAPLSFGGVPAEVVRWQGKGLVFRCSHALMDARGLLFFAEEVFRALRGEPLLGTSTSISDYEYLRAFSHSTPRRWPAANRRSPVGEPRAEGGFVHERRTVPGNFPAAGARLAHAVARLAWERDSLARLMLPVDLRQLDSAMRSTANFSSPILLELARGTPWEELYRRLLEAFARHDYRGIAASDRLIPWLPRGALEKLQSTAQRWQEKRDSFLLSGTVSHVGRVELSSLTAPGFTPRSVFLLPFDAPGSALTLISVQHDSALEIAASAPFSAAGEGRLAKALDRLLEYFAEIPAPQPAAHGGSSSVLGPVREWPPGDTALSLFLSIDGHAIAVKDRGRDFTYGELAARAREFSGLLRARGVRPGDRVAICAKHSFDTVAAILGTWYLGAAFVPLDPEWPPERIRFVLRDCAPACVVAENFPDMPFVALREPGPQDANPPAPARLAYLIYTSGSTGEPKGVEVGHESLANYLQWAREVYSPGAPPVYPLFTPLTFDLTITALLVPLVAGGAVKVVAETEPASAARAILRDREINCVKLTPSHLRLFTEINGGAVKIYVVGGEALDATLASRAAHGARVFNEYGPTEATVGCVVHEFVPGDEIVPIGKPIANTEVLLLDEKGGAVSPGGVGEIYLSGACLALGYRGRPFENHRFSPHPFRPGERVYRTGDLARLNSNGNFEYLGRADDQMKILGHRVEPGEVEAALLATKLCREAAVLAVNGHLAAYVSGVDDAGALEAAAAAVLPRWMRPAEFVSLVRLPLNQNGKVDKKKLAPPSAMPERLAEAASSLEETLRGIAAEQMGRAPGTISVRRSLHELGFDSLQLALLLTRASHLLPEGAPRDGLFTDLHGFLREPSLARLAEHLRGLGVAG